MQEEMLHTREEGPSEASMQPQDIDHAAAAPGLEQESAMGEQAVGLTVDTTEPAAMATNALDTAPAYGLDADSDDMSMSPNAVSPVPQLDNSAEMETVPEEAAAATEQEATEGVELEEVPTMEAEGAVTSSEISPVAADELVKSGDETDIVPHAGAASADDAAGITPDVIPQESASPEASPVAEEAKKDVSPVDLLGDLAPHQQQTNPFDAMPGLTAQAGTDQTNPFTGDDGGYLMQPQADIPAEPNKTDSSCNNPFGDPFKTLGDHPEEQREALERNGTLGFDPLESWGHPMGLPTPEKTPVAPKKSASRKSSGGPKATADKKAPSDTAIGKNKTASAKTTKVLASTPSKSRAPLIDDTKKNTTTKPSSSATKMHKAAPAAKKENSGGDNNQKRDEKNGGSTAAKDAAARRRLNITQKTQRPASAPNLPKVDANTTQQKAAPKPAATRRPASSVATSTSRTMANKSARSGPPVVPIYVDLTYIPCHGDSQYVDADFFRKVRARNYVLSALNPSVAILDALLEAKQTWGNGDAELSEVTLIPTYENDTLRHWMALHHDELTQQKITVAPSASRCTIQLQDHEASCSAYRIEF
ncbi:hypothetical protein NP493_617g01022 [Ridgeia piscesae]|uniref:Microtubule-associated protein futsch n=1 Tax=Ridgeia piscesae TaxID=27915 RepID=A0AAD9KTK6_RIDPI|nr:hypothetical protein NP493_617g01022 [Ridgeia piscesae]